VPAYGILGRVTLCHTEIIYATCLTSILRPHVAASEGHLFGMPRGAALGHCKVQNLDSDRASLRRSEHCNSIPAFAFFQTTPISRIKCALRSLRYTMYSLEHLCAQVTLTLQRGDTICLPKATRDSSLLDCLIIEDEMPPTW